jgi:hypothetical protein
MTTPPATISRRVSGSDRGGAMRLDGVEIKVSFGPDQTDPAMQALGLPLDQPRWQIFFCEDVNPGVSPGTPLLDGGVILRARLRSDDDADATVKLRPYRPVHQAATAVPQ